MVRSFTSSLVDYYRRTYFEWRNAYGLTDGCMRELVAAMQVELERPELEINDAHHLRKLITTIEAELDIAQTLYSNHAA